MGSEPEACSFFLKIEYYQVWKGVKNILAPDFFSLSCPRRIKNKLKKHELIQSPNEPMLFYYHIYVLDKLLKFLHFENIT